MARVRSPTYPAHSLSEVIGYVVKIHDANRQHPVSREVAAQQMGFSGLSGTSERALSSLLHYGLAEKVMKGEVRVSDLAIKILHPDHDDEFRGALNEAAFNPTLFKQLHSRYPGSPPAIANLESYLAKEGFASIAVGPAAKAFLETCRFLQQEKAYESDGGLVKSAPESSPHVETREHRPMQTQPAQAHASTPAPGLRSDIFTLEGGGEVIAKLPDSLSQRDYDDLADWLELMRKKAERKITPPAVQDNTDRGGGLAN